MSEDVWMLGRKAEFLVLTFTLNHVQVELLHGPHADLLQLRVQQHLHQRRGQMFAG